MVTETHCNNMQVTLILRISKVKCVPILQHAYRDSINDSGTNVDNFMSQSLGHEIVYIGSADLAVPVEKSLQLLSEMANDLIILLKG